MVGALICLFFYHKKQWKLYLFTAVTGFMILFYIEQIYMPAHDIEEGRLAEGLSAPIQQTARYQRDHGAEVTEEERAILSELFDDYDQMGTAHYSPEISDAAKDQMISHPTKEQLKNYLKSGLHSSASIRILISRHFLTRLTDIFIRTGRTDWERRS